jgi:hypothetical protein
MFMALECTLGGGGTMSRMLESDVDELLERMTTDHQLFLRAMSQPQHHSPMASPSDNGLSELYDGVKLSDKLKVIYSVAKKLLRAADNKQATKRTPHEPRLDAESCFWGGCTVSGTLHF